MSNANRIKLNKNKLKNLYTNIIKVLGLKGKISAKLDITSKTLDEYLNKASEYLDIYDEKLEPIYDINADFVEEKYESNKKEMLEEFLSSQGLSNVGDKYRHAFDSYCFRQKELEKEKYIYYLEQDYLDNITLSENDDEDKKIKLLILFKRIYDRAQLAIDEENCGNIDKHIKSSKNVGLAFKFLEKRNREDLADTPQVHKIEGGITHNISSFAQLANMIQEQKTKMIETSEEIIDVEFEKE